MAKCSIVAPDEAFIFKVVDSHWVCINHDDVKLLCDFLNDYRFGSLPDYVTYCICENSQYHMKYRVFGNTIIIYISKLLCYEKDSLFGD